MAQAKPTTNQPASQSSKNAQTIVIKIGTSSLTKPDTGDLRLAAIAQLVEVIVQLQRLGHRVVLVSSGAIGVGCTRLGMTDRPKRIEAKQAIAAVGQGRLIRIYDDFFAAFAQPVAQVLLTRNNLILRHHYIKVLNTFNELLQMSIVPIVNENDTIAIDEIKFGDNDTLSALVASLIEADWLFLLTDVDCLYSANPHQEETAVPISTVGYEQLQKLIGQDMGQDTGGDRPASGFDNQANRFEQSIAQAPPRPTKQPSQTNHPNQSNKWGTGGINTKLTAAKIAATAGVKTVISLGSEPQRLLSILQGEQLGTTFEPLPRAVTARKRWIAYGLIPAGKLILDAGAVLALEKSGRSLLPAGITQVIGKFEITDAVSLCDPNGVEFARGIVNYNSGDIARIAGFNSQQIPQLLNLDPNEFDGEVIHRDNMVLLNPTIATPTGT
ncbi:Glutamate 5-kinase [Thalassoporum mexicanum PCC 7367]|uniref:glutamate 5-kinase n=1 Tax=Thalassoporum mexicanum TaxID=3457544 RepID=UPI00029FA0B5|nr:glutamate 5-kinase [Pseudanabaena sp. PCC 7367]AFY71423.1 Glutamate 5-kinase [Pseudanabaena sp. PCC 7367]